MAPPAASGGWQVGEQVPRPPTCREETRSHQTHLRLHGSPGEDLLLEWLIRRLQQPITEPCSQYLGEVSHGPAPAWPQAAPVTQTPTASTRR